MKYNKFQDLELSALGFGCMRFPLLEDGKTIDEDQVAKMFDIAIKGGVNYFDTAWPYHEGMSEIVTGKTLKKYPRDSYYLASKFPAFQYKVGAEDNPKPSEIFEKQLEKCGVEYFDFYLCHNVSERTLPVFEDPEIDIIPYLIKQKELGRIKHLGFSCHAQYENLKAFVERHPGVFEFCQIQLNYLDWTLQDAKEKYDFLTEAGIPVWVM
ncbi:MAG: aldo/keto reductase [Firmicutes bacterium]|nr:aldo/keto reductase [Bacillota bacterium]